MIDVVRDMEGLRMAFAEIFEQEHDRARIERSADPGANRDRLLASLAPLTLSPGYHRACYHLMALDGEVKAGIPLDPRTLSAWEASGLVTLARCRNAFEHKHPACGACGIRQANRYLPKCEGCGVEFRRKQ